MNRLDGVTYVDRATGNLVKEKIYARGFLDWSYNTRMGQWLTDIVFRQRWVSSLYGWLHRRSWSKRKIRRFVSAMNIDMTESLRTVEQFASFNDFFVREIDTSKRNINNDPSVCVAPTDGKVLAYPEIGAGRSFRIKRSEFNLLELVQRRDVAELFDGGSMIISRLALSDYHHVHFPDSGIPGAAFAIFGKYYAGGPYSMARLVPFYRENYRMFTLFDSEHFGRMGIVEIGAFTVGSIRQTYTPNLHVAKGDRKGFFELGGSTVVLVFQKNAITLDEDLCKNEERGLETYVRFGDSIGRQP
jgi:phosphatidylserine decarboxylase